jgi:hypothetical protein
MAFLGIKVADGAFYPVLVGSRGIPARKHLVLSPANGGQTSAQIDFFVNNTLDIETAIYLGSIVTDSLVESAHSELELFVTLSSRGEFVAEILSPAGRYHMEAPVYLFLDDDSTPPELIPPPEPPQLAASQLPVSQPDAPQPIDDNNSRWAPPSGAESAPATSADNVGKHDDQPADDILSVDIAGDRAALVDEAHDDTADDIIALVDEAHAEVAGDAAALVDKVHGDVAGDTAALADDAHAEAADDAAALVDDAHVEVAGDTAALVDEVHGDVAGDAAARVDEVHGEAVNTVGDFDAKMHKKAAPKAGRVRDFPLAPIMIASAVLIIVLTCGAIWDLLFRIK